MWLVIAGYTILWVFDSGYTSYCFKNRFYTLYFVSYDEMRRVIHFLVLEEIYCVPATLPLERLIPGLLLEREVKAAFTRIRCTFKAVAHLTRPGPGQVIRLDFLKRKAQ
jgi:hypothetical protein